MIESWVANDAAGNLSAGDECASIQFVSKVVGPYRRGCSRIRRFGVDRALRFRPALVDRQRHPWSAVELPDRRISIARVGEEILDVRHREPWARPDKSMSDSSGEGQHTATLRIVFDDLLGQCETTGLLVESDRQLNPPVQARGVMVAIVLANAPQIMSNRDLRGF